MIGRPTSTKLAAVPNVVVLNNWPHSAVLQAWQRCSVGLAPSVWGEPFGLVVLEAMEAGRPVIGSRTGGICDTIVDHETGFLLPPGDAAALRAVIQQLVASPDLRERLGRAARRRAALFTANAVVPHIEKVYRELIDPQPARTNRSPQAIDAAAPGAAPEAAPDV
jgi:glycosyltransferase involved in cell wall biosynthesis